MASSLLSAFGVTPAAPPASAYADQTAETENLAHAKAQLADVTSTLGLVLTGAKLAGVDTTNLDNLNAEANSLSGLNLTAAQLQAKTTALSAKLATVQATQDAQRKAAALKTMQDAVTAIKKRVAAVKVDTTTSAQLLQKYKDLEGTAENALTALKAAPAKKEGFATGSTAEDTPEIPRPEALLSQLDDLDTAKEAEENKSFNWTRFGKKITSVMMFYGTIISIGIGAVLGGIIMSNIYASDPFWGIKVYYFIYGAAFFPLSLIYGAVKTPYWVSGTIPLYSLDPVEQTGGAFTFPSLPAIPALNSIKKSLTTAKLPTVASLTKTLTDKIVPAVATIGTAAAVAAVAPVAPVAEPVASAPVAPAPPPPPVDPKQPVAPPAPAVTTSDRLFGYKLVDPNTPTAAQTSSRNMLRYFAIGELVFLASSAVYYGVDFMIVNNLIKV
jgi:hypothetical protein